MEADIALAEAPTGLLTYEDYMAEDEDNRRYDILDGVRYYQSGCSIQHQEVLMNIFEARRAYQRREGRGKAFIGPRDVLIRREPFRLRQPDALFISRERYGGRSPQSVEPLSPAPELAVEVLSADETRRVLLGKIGDYCTAGVEECWLVSPAAETVEVLRLTPEGPVREALYGSGQTLQSLTFPDLTLALDDIFRIEE